MVSACVPWASSTQPGSETQRLEEGEREWGREWKREEKVEDGGCQSSCWDNHGIETEGTR